MKDGRNSAFQHLCHSALHEGPSCFQKQKRLDPNLKLAGLRKQVCSPQLIVSCDDSGVRQAHSASLTGSLQQLTQAVLGRPKALAL
eukprot:16013-Heterococcus_DN1.PRE.3